MIMEEIKIGNQIWMKRNLDIDTFQNGDPILQAKTNVEWVLASENKEPAWCNYANDSKNGEIYGRLYNWFAISDSRKIAPEGWHVATNEEWTELINNLGEDPGKKLKSEIYWKKNNLDEDNGNNQSLFSALPGGYRAVEGEDFRHINLGGLWWSATKTNEEKAFYRSLLWNFNIVIKFSGNFVKGLSVRCVKDSIDQIEETSTNIMFEKKGSEVDLSDSKNANNFLNFLNNKD
jgi:uncharacterized protein (TIGR02145 family)